MTLSPADLKSLAAYRAQHGTSDGFVPIAPKKKRKNEEFVIQCALVAWWAENCASFGIPEFLLWHTPNSAVYGGSKAQREKMGAMLKRLGQRSGVPDIALMTPRIHWGGELGTPTRTCTVNHGLFLELKAPNGVVSPDQKIMLPELQRQGYATAVCWTLEDAQGEITRYLSP
jgi:hypothetical protein